jgi:sensor histidine kinase regulating citrate/malate metabolism
MYDQAPKLAGTLSLCGCMLLLTDMMSIFLLEHLEKQQIAIRDNAILQQNLKSERDSIGIWVEAYRQERKRSHDFQNQLSVLRGMVEEQAPTDSFLSYLDSLLNVKLPATRYIDTGRPVADVLLSQKAAIAANKEIRFQMQLDNLSTFPLSDDALVVVLANLLDNAIEACEKIEEPAQRIIRLRMQAALEAHFLYVDNPTAQPVQIVNNQVVSTKKDGLEHGYGLKNIATILDQLDAIYAIDYQAEQHLFRFSAQFVPQE